MITRRRVALVVFVIGALATNSVGPQLPSVTVTAMQLPPQAAACAAVSVAVPTGVRVTSAELVPSQAQWSPGGRGRGFAVASPFCRVQGVIDTEIGFELWLPAADAWNGKLLGAGVGGDAGTFNFTDLPRGVARGYAAATTDTGHKAEDTQWMLGDPMRLTNFEYRAHHRLAEVAKAFIASHYGRAPQHAYFIGCSGGGRQGLKEMQKFPGDYDGIIAGAAGPKTPEMTVRRMWELLLRDANPSLMTPADWRLIADEGTKACDRADGVADGVAEDPRACRFTLASLKCTGEKTAGCLTGEQVAFAEKFYQPLRDANGRALDDGLLPGIVVDSGRSRLAPATFGQAVRKRADWTGQDFDVAADLAAVNRVMPDLRADVSDLRAFEARGGKAILYQGWMDPAVAAKMAVEYQDAVRQQSGGQAAADEFIRLFMVPGMFHCAGGPGADQFGGSGSNAPIPDADHDLLSALEAWVERGRAPETIVATKIVNGVATRTRPLCAYPAVAEYSGTGSTDVASNFRCVRR